MKLDRYLARHAATGRTGAKYAIAAGRVTVDGRVSTDSTREVNRFSRVTLDARPLGAPEPALYFMLHKPAGILSATRDPVHRTVIDLIDDPRKHTLHLAGRLDRATTGLVLLTNDGSWSKRLTGSEHGVPKVYLVETRDPIHPAAVEAFARGFHFQTEDIVTLPADLEILGERLARLTIREGRYHQVKRMFHRLNNRVVRLHRERIGPLSMPETMPPGAWRALHDHEVSALTA